MLYHTYYTVLYTSPTSSGTTSVHVVWPSGQDNSRIFSIFSVLVSLNHLSLYLSICSLVVIWLFLLQGSYQLSSYLVLYFPFVKMSPLFYSLCFYMFNSVLLLYQLVEFFIISYSPSFLRINWSKYLP